MGSENNEEDWTGLGEPPKPRKPPGAAHAAATKVAMLRYGMGRSATPEAALDDGVKFVRAVEARWPGAIRAVMGGE